MEIEELCSPGCAVTKHPAEIASKVLFGVIEATKERGLNMLLEDLSSGVGENYLVHLMYCRMSSGIVWVLRK